MNDKYQPYITATVQPIKIEYTNDKADVRKWLLDLKRDLARKMQQIDELLLTLPVDKG